MPPVGTRQSAAEIWLAVCLTIRARLSVSVAGTFLAGPLMLDAVPAPQPAYDAAQLAGADAAKAATGSDAPKTDAAVGRASGTTAPGRRGLLQRLRPFRRTPR